MSTVKHEQWFNQLLHWLLPYVSSFLLILLFVPAVEDVLILDHDLCSLALDDSDFPLAELARRIYQKIPMSVIEVLKQNNIKEF